MSFKVFLVQVASVSIPELKHGSCVPTAKNGYTVFVPVSLAVKQRLTVISFYVKTVKILMVD